MADIADTNFDWSTIWGDLPAGDVSHDRALGVPAVQRGIKLISGAIARVPLKAYRRRPDGNRDRRPNHHAEKLLGKGRWSNDYCSSLALKRHVTAQALLWGNGFARIVRDQDTYEPIALYPLHAGDVRCVTDHALGIRGYIWDRPTERGQVPTALTFDEMLHIPNVITDHTGWVGRSFVSLAQEALGTIVSTETFGKTYYENNGRPGLVVTMPTPPKQPGKRSPEEVAEADRQAWAERFQGAHKAGTTAIVPTGTQVMPLDASPALDGLAALKELGTVDAANLLGIPASFLNAAINVSYKSLLEDSRSLTQYTLDDWFHSWEAAGSLLMTERDRRSNRVYIEFERASLYQTDTSATQSDLLALEAAGIITKDEVRQKLNFTPMELDEDPDEPDPEPEDEEQDETDEQEAEDE